MKWTRKLFTGNGDDFSAFHEAEEFVRRNGFDIGSMESKNPIGIHRNATISKWTRMSREEQESLDGRMESEDFRNGHVTVLFRED